MPRAIGQNQVLTSLVISSVHTHSDHSERAKKSQILFKYSAYVKYRQRSCKVGIPKSIPYSRNIAFLHLSPYALLYRFAVQLLNATQFWVSNLQDWFVMKRGKNQYTYKGAHGQLENHQGIFTIENQRDSCINKTHILKKQQKMFIIHGKK